MSKTTFTYGLATTKGSQRKINLDSAIALTWSDVPRFSGQSVGLFIVADGMGAPDEGLRASQVAIQIVSEEITADIFHQSEVSINLIMTAAVQKANRQVFVDAADSGAGATLTAALLIGNQLYIAHVGDILAYYAYGKYLIQLTEIHDLVHRYIALGLITWEQVGAGHIVENLLYRALGQSEDLMVDIVTERLAPNSYLLLSSDGLWALRWKNIEAIEPLDVIQNNPPQLACELLTELSQKCGSGDDITVIVVKLSEDHLAHRLPYA
jgi:serine/threonine protein phosphatase PrpC